MKLSEIRELSENEAMEKLQELRAELSKENALIASGTRPEKPGRVRNLRRIIARILTVVREKKGIKSGGTREQKRERREKKVKEKREAQDKAREENRRRKRKRSEKIEK